MPSSPSHYPPISYGVVRLFLGPGALPPISAGGFEYATYCCFGSAGYWYWYWYTCSPPANSGRFGLDLFLRLQNPKNQPATKSATTATAPTAIPPIAPPESPEECETGDEVGVWLVVGDAVALATPALVVLEVVVVVELVLVLELLVADDVGKPKDTGVPLSVKFRKLEPNIPPYT
jgi:hypothetical protein